MARRRTAHTALRGSEKGPLTLLTTFWAVLREDATGILSRPAGSTSDTDACNYKCSSRTTGTSGTSSLATRLLAWSPPCLLHLCQQLKMHPFSMYIVCS